MTANLNSDLRYVQPLPLAAKGDDPVGGTICINSGDDNDNYHHQYNDNDNFHAWVHDNYNDNDDDSQNFRGSHDIYQKAGKRSCFKIFNILLTDGCLCLLEYNYV